MVPESIRRSPRGSRVRAGVGVGGGTRVGVGSGEAVGSAVAVGAGVAVGTGVGVGSPPQAAMARTAKNTTAAGSSRGLGVWVVMVGLPYARGLALDRLGVG